MTTNIPTSIKLTGRTGHQVSAAEHYLPSDVVAVGKTTITLTGENSGIVSQALQAAIAQAQQAGDKGGSQALHSVRRAFGKAAWPAEAGAVTTTKAGAKRAPKAAKEATVSDSTTTAQKPATGPRGEILDRKGVAIESGPLAGYVVAVPFREFETLRRTKATAADRPESDKWVTRCVEHDTFQAADSGTIAEKAGARKVRVTWCAGCAAAAK